MVGGITMESISKTKNILFITSDQQHWMTLGVNNPNIKTPNLDRLANTGITFDRAYTVNPTCTPTRGTLITGMYPSQHGGWTLGTKVMEKTETIGDILIRNNFETGLVGKAHFQPLASSDSYTSLESYPLLQDLEYWKRFNKRFYGFKDVELARSHVYEAHVGQHYALWMEDKGYKNWKDYFLPPTGNYIPSRNSSGSTRQWDIPEEIHNDHWIAERTNALMDKYVSEKKQFFLWASFFDPHPPYSVPGKWADASFYTLCVKKQFVPMIGRP